MKNANRDKKKFRTKCRNRIFPNQHILKWCDKMSKECNLYSYCRERENADVCKL